MSLAQHNYNSHLVTQLVVVQLMLLPGNISRSQGPCGKAKEYSCVVAISDGMSQL